MLLPIVLLLASAGAVQQAATVLPTAEQSSESEQNRGVISHSGPNRFVNPGQNSVPRGKPLLDQGIIVPKNPCLADGTCQPVCASITAHVFSDGENPQPLYVTDCPNLEVPFETKRAHGDVPENKRQPKVKRIAD